ncbi:MAG: acylneuraminate cytidylyltransferase family protein, partial [Candidatus Peribacteraceae bacterium]|nr:acylneuraminate cytidylyltransferase family protein [Candidatus Peribacteraceae bacterium]
MPSNVLCIIPARGGSKRFPGKNLALFDGKPLVGLAAEVAKESGLFETICISSDDEAIRTAGGEHGADYLYERPSQFAEDDVQLADVCTDLLGHLKTEGKEFDAFAILTPANPLRAVEDLTKAWELLQDPNVEVVLSVTAHLHSPQRALAVRENRLTHYFPNEDVEHYDVEERLYYHDAAVVFVRTEPFLKTGRLFGSNDVPYFTPEERSVNIDYPIELEWAEFIRS